ncbi:MAG: YIP1 family protein [Lachnospiraceae bacterium]|nr:YIP1 family protein [Lachnospiraceae bacterium]
MKKMYNHFKRVALSLMVMILALCSIEMPVSADSPYKTYTFDGYGYIIQTQSAYLPYETITKFDEEALSGPSDMQVTDDGLIYVADTGNSRIVVGDLEGNLIKIIGEGILQTPKGVYVTANKDVYVADRDAKRIFQFNENGELIKEYGKPTSPLYGEDLDFLPLKLVVNDAGIMYVVCESNTNGIVQISPTEGGTFLGYFGTNTASASPWLIFRRMIATDAQRAKMVSNIPSTPDNLCIDQDGLIYTVTRGERSDTLKRLNIAGANVIEPEAYDEIPAAVAAGNHDNVYMVSQQGYIYEFNSEGESLFVFGGLDDGTQRVGLCTLVSAIDVDPQDRIYILDMDKCQIQVFEPTEFTNLLHEALNLYSTGRYTESKAPLEEVLKMNSMFDYANMAMGRAYFQEENYEAAQYYAKLAKDYTGYSDAAWEIRNLWLKDWIVPIIWIVVIFMVLKKVVAVLDEKKKMLDPVRAFKKKLTGGKFISDLKYAWYFMKHPIDGSYGIAREGRASLRAANFLVLLFTVEFMINKYLCGFLQKTIREGRYEILSDIGIIVVVLIALTACNYLVCTINDGEGTVKKIYCSFTYCLTPYITLTPVVFLFSHVVTNNEQFLVDFTNYLILAWMAVLFVLAVKEVNNYTAQETFKVICLTAFTILIMALLIFIIYVLWAQVFEFIIAIGGEVVYRIGN